MESPEKKSGWAAAALGLSSLVGLGAWWTWQDQAPAPSAVFQAQGAEKPASAATTAVEPAASAPAVMHPLDLPAPVAGATVAAGMSPAESVLTELFGRKSALGMFQLDDFERRLVATVDNLGRSHASARVWPMNPAEGRFLTERHGDADVIATDNGLRYTPYVLLIETVDLHQVVDAYRRLYPRLQEAYEAQGYPGRYFNDRVVEVLDQLIATPDLDVAPRVHLPVIHGPVQPERPWVLYEFEDPALQALTVGQRILLRTGPVNAHRLKARLTELRRLLASGATRR